MQIHAGEGPPASETLWCQLSIPANPASFLPKRFKHCPTTSRHACPEMGELSLALENDDLKLSMLREAHLTYVNALTG